MIYIIRASLTCIIYLAAFKVDSVEPIKGSSLAKDSSEAIFGPLIAFFFGIFLITAAFPIIWMNERRQVRMYKVY